ncbi:MAG: zinc-binding dehydrogenase [candidate division NC10 bacterium]|nr:zinc-binding dehydrogenase [candidate division NC10 bacterium]
MMAVRFHQHGGPEVLRYEEAPDPAPGDAEVLLQVRAVALNHLDVWLRKGLPGMKVSLPKIGGCDVAGLVAAVGSRCARIRAGQRVLVSPGISCGQCAACLRGDDNLCRDFQMVGGYTLDGGCAEFLAVPEVNCIVLPPEMDFAEAAAIPVTFLTAWHMLIRLGRLQAGERLLVMGAGSGVGTAAIQIGRLVGARVIAVAGSQEKLARARDLGAEAGIDHTAQGLAQEVRRLTERRGVDVVFEHVGGTTWGALLPNIAPGGRLVTCGATAGYETSVDIRYLFSRNIAILGAHLGTKAEMLEVVGHVARGALHAVVDRVLPLAECAAGHRLLEERAVFGKVVLTP